MWELRWVLLALGIVLIAGVWIWSGRSSRDSGKSKKTAGSGQRRAAPEDQTEADTEAPSEGMSTTSVEAAAEDEEEPENAAGDSGEETVHAQGAAEQLAAGKADPIDRVITIRCQTKEGNVSVEQVVLALRAAGLVHGQYDIFHRQAEDAESEPVFSVANLTEPGSFDLTRASESTTAGITLFMVLPGQGDAVERFDMMTLAARELAGELDAELYDESGSFWSIQRERYVRDEVILYGLKREKR